MCRIVVVGCCRSVPVMLGAQTYHFDVCLDGVEMVTVNRRVIATTSFQIHTAMLGWIHCEC